MAENHQVGPGAESPQKEIPQKEGGVSPTQPEAPGMLSKGNDNNAKKESSKGDVDHGANGDSTSGQHKPNFKEFFKSNGQEIFLLFFVFVAVALSLATMGIDVSHLKVTQGERDRQLAVVRAASLTTDFAAEIINTTAQAAINIAAGSVQPVVVETEAYHRTTNTLSKLEDEASTAGASSDFAFARTDVESIRAAIATAAETTPFVFPAKANTEFMAMANKIYLAQLKTLGEKEGLDGASRLQLGAICFTDSVAQWSFQFQLLAEKKWNLMAAPTDTDLKSVNWRDVNEYFNYLSTISGGAANAATQTSATLFDSALCYDTIASIKLDDPTTTASSTAATALSADSAKMTALAPEPTFPKASAASGPTTTPSPLAAKPAPHTPAPIGDTSSAETRIDYDTITPMEASLIVVQHVQKLQAKIQEASEDEHNEQVRKAIEAIVMACAAAAAILAVFIISVILIVRFKSGETALTDIRYRYKTLEARAKFLPRYQNVLQAGSVREGDRQLQRQHKDTFLNKVIDFVAMLRPYIPQSAFGDIEHVSMTGSKFASRAVLSAEITNTEQAIRELHLRDLRIESGLQLVAGTCFHMDLGAQFSFAGNPSKTAKCFDDANGLLGYVEHLINGASGIIRGVSGDGLDAIWNVTSSTPNPHLKAVQCALLITKRYKKTSIGIAHSPMIAGNIATSSRQSLHLIGPAVVLSERLQGYTSAFGAPIIVDSPTAENASSIENATKLSDAVGDSDFCFRPAVILPARDEHDDPVIGHGIYRYKQKSQRAKMWSNTFKEISTDYAANKFGSCLDTLQRYTSVLENKKSKPDQLAALWASILAYKLDKTDRRQSDVPEM